VNRPRQVSHFLPLHLPGWPGAISKLMSIHRQVNAAFPWFAKGFGPRHGRRFSLTYAFADGYDENESVSVYDQRTHSNR